MLDSNIPTFQQSKTPLARSGTSIPVPQRPSAESGTGRSQARRRQADGYRRARGAHSETAQHHQPLQRMRDAALARVGAAHVGSRGCRISARLRNRMNTSARQLVAPRHQLVNEVEGSRVLSSSARLYRTSTNNELHDVLKQSFKKPSARQNIKAVKEIDADENGSEG